MDSYIFELVVHHKLNGPNSNGSGNESSISKIKSFYRPKIGISS